MNNQTNIVTPISEEERMLNENADVAGHRAGLLALRAVLVALEDELTDSSSEQAAGLAIAASKITHGLIAAS